MKRTLPLLAAVALAAGCAGSTRKPAEALFIGIDVSGSFQNNQAAALEFASRYIHARLNAYGTLNPVKHLFVGSIGGQETEDNKSFHPIQDFQRKTPDQILTDLQVWFPKSDRYTDFNIFVRQVAAIAKKRNMALSPITIVLLSDGIPDAPGAELDAAEAPYHLIDLSPLEFLSRKVTVRLLYTSPVVSNRWETRIARKRVRMWTVDDQVMAGWKGQWDSAKRPEEQELLWKWVADNVDFRVRQLAVRVGGAQEYPTAASGS